MGGRVGVACGWWGRCYKVEGQFHLWVLKTYLMHKTTHHEQIACTIAMEELKLPTSLSEAVIPSLPATAYYIPDFISCTEEALLLNKVLICKLWYV